MLRTPPTCDIHQAHVQHFQQNHQVETKQLIDFLFCIFTGERFARIGQLIRTRQCGHCFVYSCWKQIQLTQPQQQQTRNECFDDVMCDLLEQHWLSSTKHEAENAFHLSWWVCSNLHESKFEWDENKFVFSLFRTELWVKWTRLDRCNCSSVVVMNWAKSAVFWKSHKNWKNCEQRSLFCGPKLFLRFYWSAAEQKPKLNKTKKKLFGQPKQNKTKKGKRKNSSTKVSFCGGSQKPWTSHSWAVVVLLGFLAALCITIVLPKRVVWVLGVQAWVVFSDVSTPILFQKRSLWFVSVTCQVFCVTVDLFELWYKFLLLCFFSVWSGFSGWRSTPLCLSCFMSGFHELFRLLLMSCCCQVGSPCAYWTQFSRWRVINSSMRSCLCSVWWSRNQIIRTESTSICLVRKVLPTMKSNRWFFQTFFSSVVLFSVASFLACNSFVVSLVVTTTPIALHPEIDWGYHSFGDFHEVQVQQIAITPDTLTCSRKKVLNCWFCRLVFAFFLCFFFFGCVGVWLRSRNVGVQTLIDVFVLWTTNNNFKKKRVPFPQQRKKSDKGKQEQERYFNTRISEDSANPKHNHPKTKSNQNCSKWHSVGENKDKRSHCFSWLCFFCAIFVQFHWILIWILTEKECKMSKLWEEQTWETRQLIPRSLLWKTVFVLNCVNKNCEQHNWWSVIQYSFLEAPANETKARTLACAAPTLLVAFSKRQTPEKADQQHLYGQEDRRNSLKMLFGKYEFQKIWKQSCKVEKLVQEALTGFVINVCAEEFTSTGSKNLKTCFLTRVSNFQFEIYPIYKCCVWKSYSFTWSFLDDRESLGFAHQHHQEGSKLWSQERFGVASECQVQWVMH